MKHALFLIHAAFSQTNTTRDWIGKYKLKNTDPIIEATEDRQSPGKHRNRPLDIQKAGIRFQ
jgi:hypothetical protein